MKSKLLLACAVSVAAAGTAQAQWMTQAPASPFYIGGSLGQASTDLGTGRIDSDLRNLGFSNVRTTTDDDDTAWRVFGGYRLLPYAPSRRWMPGVALELGYANLGEGRYSSGVSSLTGPGSLGINVETTVWSLDVVPSIEVAPRLNVLGRIGYVHAETEASFSSSGSVRLTRTSETKRRDTYKVGLGAQYDFTPRLGARLEWERYFDLGSDAVGGKFDADVFSVSAVFRF